MTDSEVDLRALREQLGESQAAFGQRFGVDQSTVHRWETKGAPKRGPARLIIDRLLAEFCGAPS
jgi:DNA-binding transcriptional regulator YiaG